MKLTFEITDEQMALLADELFKRLQKRLNQVSNPDPEALTLKEAARRLGVSPATVRRRVKAGLIPRVKGLSNFRISVAHIDRLLGNRPAGM